MSPHKLDDDEWREGRFFEPTKRNKKEEDRMFLALPGYPEYCFALCGREERSGDFGQEGTRPKGGARPASPGLP